MAKETVSTLPILLFFYVFCCFEENMDLRKLFTKVNLKIALNVFISLLPLAISIAALQYYTFEYGVWLVCRYSNPILPYWRTQSYVWLHYFIAYFFPFNLSADTDLSIITNPFDTRVLSGFAFMILLIIGIIKTSSIKVWRPVANRVDLVCRCSTSYVFGSFGRGNEWPAGCTIPLLGWT